MVKVENNYLTIHSLIAESESRKLTQITGISSQDCHTCACSFNANCLVRIMIFSTEVHRILPKCFFMSVCSGYHRCLTMTVEKVWVWTTRFDTAT